MSISKKILIFNTRETFDIAYFEICNGESDEWHCIVFQFVRENTECAELGGVDEIVPILQQETVSQDLVEVIVRDEAQILPCWSTYL